MIHAIAIPCDRPCLQWSHMEYDNRGMSDGCPVPDEAPSLIAKHPQLPRGVPTVYGRFTKLTVNRKPSKAACTKSALHGKSGRLNMKIRN